jgi:D-citramalate synthase
MRRGDPRRIEVMDTTLRDGEQTPDVAYTPAEKLQLARLLLANVGVDRIEIGQARVSIGELEAVRRVAAWARREKMLPRVEILGYCDGRQSVDWIVAAGGKVLNLLTKGSERHCRMQLRMEPAEHRSSAEQTLAHARRRRLFVNAYLEDWSSGVRDSFDYVFAMVEALRRGGVKRIYLADTLGILGPEDVTRYVGLMTATWPQLCFEFHAHNDYGLATANCLAAVRAGARGVHTSVNGMGERAGNTHLAEAVAAIHDDDVGSGAGGAQPAVRVSEKVARAGVGLGRRRDRESRLDLAGDARGGPLHGAANGCAGGNARNARSPRNSYC